MLLVYYSDPVNTTGTTFNLTAVMAEWEHTVAGLSQQLSVAEATVSGMEEARAAVDPSFASPGV